MLNIISAVSSIITCILFIFYIIGHVGYSFIFSYLVGLHNGYIMGDRKNMRYNKYIDNNKNTLYNI